MKTYSGIPILALSVLMGCARAPDISTPSSSHVLSVEVERAPSAPEGMVGRYYLDGDEITGDVMTHVRRVRGACILKVELPSGRVKLGVDWAVVSDLMAYCRESRISVSYYLAGRAREFHLLCWHGYTGADCDPASIEYVFDGQHIGRGRSGAEFLASKTFARDTLVLLVWPWEAPWAWTSASGPAFQPLPEGLRDLWDQWLARGLELEYAYSRWRGGTP